MKNTKNKKIKVRIVPSDTPEEEKYKRLFQAFDIVLGEEEILKLWKRASKESKKK